MGIISDGSLISNMLNKVLITLADGETLVHDYLWNSMLHLFLYINIL